MVKFRMMDTIEVSPEVRQAHERLSAASLQYLEFVKKNPETLRRASFGSLDWGHERYKFQPWPTFISQYTRQEFEQAAVKVFDLITKIPDRVFDFDAFRMAAYYGLEPEHVEYCLLGVDNHHIGNLLGRGDFVYSPQGLKCLEFNIVSNLGGLELPMWEAMFLRNPLNVRFLENYNIRLINQNLLENALDHLLKASLEKFPWEKEINVVLAITKTEGVKAFSQLVSLDQMYRAIMERRANNLAGQIFICDLTELQSSGGFLFYNGERIHTILEYYNGRLPHEWLAVFIAGKVLILNGPVCNVASNKLNLALLSEHADSDIFSPPDRETIKTYIPWTRKIIDGLKEFIIANKNNLVIKPGAGMGGEGVYIGRYTPGAQWKEFVEMAVREQNWVVQEYVESLSYVYQAGEYGAAEYIAAWGFFVFGSRYSGEFLRLMPKEGSRGVINSLQGAEKSIVFGVEE